MKNKLPNISHNERHLPWLNMPEVCLEKNYRKLLERCVVESFPTPQKIHECMATVEPLQLADMDNVHNEIKVSFPLMF